MELFKSRKNILMVFLFSIMMFRFMFNFLNEAGFQRFPNTFVAGLEMYDKRYATFGNVIPFFNSSYNYDFTLSNRANGVLKQAQGLPFLISLMLILNELTNLEFQKIMVISIGAFLVPICFIMFFKSFNKIMLDTTTLLFIMYVISYLFNRTQSTNFYISGISYSLAFLILAHFNKINKHNNNKSYLIIILLFISIANYWHSVLILLYLLISINICYIFFTGYKNKVSFRLIYLLFILTFILILATYLWQKSYLNLFIREADIYEFITSFFIKIQGDEPFIKVHQYSYKESLLGFIFYNVEFYIRFIWLIAACIILIKNKIYRYNYDNYLCVYLISIIFAQIIFVFLYYRTTSINLIYIPLFISPIVFNLVRKKKYIKPKLFVSLLGVILIFSIITNIIFVGTNHFYEVSLTKYDNTKGSFKWFNTFYYDHPIYVDFNTMGKFMQREAQIQKPTMDFQFITIDFYVQLLNITSNNINYSDSYLIMDWKSIQNKYPIHLNTHTLLKSYPNKIINSDLINICYNDNMIIIAVID